MRPPVGLASSRQDSPLLGGAVRCRLPGTVLLNPPCCPDGVCSTSAFAPVERSATPTTAASPHR